MKKILLLLVTFFFMISEAEAFDPMDMPKFNRYVNDFSNVLTQVQIQEFDILGKDHEGKTTNQVVVVLFPNRNGNELLDIGLKTFRENGVGQKIKNNGILLLISTQEKKIRIVTGYGLEGDIPDILASDIIEKDIRPFVNNGDFYTGIKNYYSRVEKAIANHEGDKFKNTAHENLNVIKNLADERLANERGESFLFIFLGIFIGSLLRFVKLIYKAIFVVITAISAIYSGSLAIYLLLIGAFIGFFIKLSTLLLLFLSGGRRGSGSGGGGGSG